jgi:8-oxo-dGTP diphosphatase
MTSSTTTANKRNWLPVVAGVICRGDKILLGKRPADSNLPNLWEFPGGKIEMTEGPEEALKRELQEELGIVADVGPLMIATSHPYGHLRVLILFYKVMYWQFEPKALHHQELGWFTKDEIKRLDMPEANRNVLDRIFSSLK